MDPPPALFCCNWLYVFTNKSKEKMVVILQPIEHTRLKHCRFNAGDSTSRRFNVELTLFQRCVLAGNAFTVVEYRDALFEFNMNIYFTEDFVDWIEVQVETTLAFVSCIGALILAVNALVYVYEQPRVYLAWQIVTAVISGKEIVPYFFKLPLSYCVCNLPIWHRRDPLCHASTRSLHTYYKISVQCINCKISVQCILQDLYTVHILQDLYTVQILQDLYTVYILQDPYTVHILRDLYTVHIL